MRAIWILGCALSLAACGSRGDGAGSTVTAHGPLGFHRTVDLTIPEGEVRSVSVRSGAGSVRVGASADGTVSARATLRADREDRLDAIELDTMRTPDGRLAFSWTCTLGPAGAAVDYDVLVPAGTTFDLHTGAGSVQVQGLEAAGAVRTDAGNVAVRGVRGALSLHSGAGSVDATGVEGVVSIDTAAGNVEVSGRLAGESRIESGAGGLVVRLPADLSLKVDGRTGAGSASSEFPEVLVTGGPGSARLSGNLGAGAGTLLLRTDAGNITLRRE